MVDYKTVKRPGALKSAALLPEEVAILGLPVNVAAGLRNSEDGDDVPGQLDLRYVDGKTYVQPIGGPPDLAPWRHDGSISPDDCRAFWRAKAASLRTNVEKEPS